MTVCTIGVAPRTAAHTAVRMAAGRTAADRTAVPTNQRKLGRALARVFIESLSDFSATAKAITGVGDISASMRGFVSPTMGCCAMILDISRGRACRGFDRRARKASIRLSPLELRQGLDSRAPVRPHVRRPEVQVDCRWCAGHGVYPPPFEQRAGEGLLH
jgi:hypothetical protein